MEAVQSDDVSTSGMFMDYALIINAYLLSKKFTERTCM